MAKAKRTTVAFVTSFVLLNIYLAWDSRLLRTISPTASSIVTGIIKGSDMAVWSSLRLYKISTYTYIVTDFEVLIILMVMVVSAFLLTRGKGLAPALLRTTQVAALCLVAFGVELGLFDCSEFFLHVTDFQISFNFIPWFNNAEMLAAAFAILAESTLLLIFLRPASPSPRARGRFGALAAYCSGKTMRFLILFLFGVLFVVGGSMAAYYGGVWRISYSNGSGTAATNGVISLGSVPSGQHDFLTSYTNCFNQLKFFSNLAKNSSCGFDSLNTGQLLFVAFGGTSMLLGAFTIRRPLKLLAQRPEGRSLLLASLITPLGTGFGHFTVDRISSGRINIIVLSIEVVIALALLVSDAELMGLLKIPAAACAMHTASPYLLP